MENWNLLLIEDSIRDRDLIIETIKGSPFTVHYMEDVPDESQETPDAVLLDLILNATQGIESVEKAREIFPHTPIVVLTSLIDPELEANCIIAGADGFFRKATFEQEELLRSLRGAIRSYSIRLSASGKVTETVRYLEYVRELLWRTNRLIEQLREQQL